MSLAEGGQYVCVCVVMVVNLNADTRPEGDLKATVLVAYGRIIADQCNGCMELGTDLWLLNQTRFNPGSAPMSLCPVFTVRLTLYNTCCLALRAAPYSWSPTPAQELLSTSF